MPRYVRNYIQGGTYFFTVVTYNRRPWLCTDRARLALRLAIESVREKLPFLIDAWVLLPDHLHCIWTLPQDDHDFSTRWRLLRGHVSRALAEDGERLTISRQKRRERGLWQRRFWEHTIRDEADFTAHCDYIHFNPVKHGLCDSPLEWEYSTFHRFVDSGLYVQDWGAGSTPQFDEGIGCE